MHLAAATGTAVRDIERALGQRLKPYMSFERAATIAIDAIYVVLRDHVVLARCFAVLPLSALPPTERDFALHLTDTSMKDDARVLTLIGSRGTQARWNVRRSSERHLAVPLDAGGRSSPMIASLLADIDTDSARNGVARTFYVFDAATSVDAAGRLKISDDKFVHEHEVRTVFGVGAVLPEVIYTMIFFVRHHVTRSIADQFVPIGTTFANLTAKARATAHFFDGA